MSYSDEKENLKKEINTVPNLITGIRFLGTLVLFPLIFTVGITWPIIGLTAAIGATDKVDGWYARKYNATSLFGKVFDPITDKVFSYGVAISLIATGVIPILNPLVLAPVLFTIYRDCLIFKKAIDSRIRTSVNNTTNEKEEEKDKGSEEEKNSNLTLKEKVTAIKKNTVHKLNNILESAREKEKDPLIVSMPAKVKMVLQVLGILGFMCVPVGIPYAYIASTILFWGMAGCSFLDLELSKQDDARRMAKLNQEVVAPIIEEKEDTAQKDLAVELDKGLVEQREVSELLEDTDNLVTPRPKQLLKAISFPGRTYIRYKE